MSADQFYCAPVEFVNFSKVLYKIMNKKSSQLPGSIIYGRNSVLEFLKAGKRSANKLLISRTARGAVISEIISIARRKGIAVHSVPAKKFDRFSDFSQGVAMEVSPIEYMEFTDLIEKSKKSVKPLLVVIDGIEDPHNLGAIIRNCVAFGVCGVIIPKWRSVGINGTVAKSSAGAVEYISISKVVNTNWALNLLKKNGFWIVGAENKSHRILGKYDLPFPLAIVIGGENFGIHTLTKKKCDFLVSIQQESTISSLNASCASAVILYETLKTRSLRQ